MTDISALQSMKGNLKDMQAKLDAIEKEVQEKSSELFSSEAKHLFDQYPFVGAVKWEQYTPYFNDGEECTFSAHCPTSDSSYGDLHFLCAGEDLDTNTWDYESSEKWHNLSQETLSDSKPNPDYDPAEISKPYNQQDRSKTARTTWVDRPNPDYNPQYQEAEKAFEEFFAQFSEDMYKRLFGDHAACTLTRDGVEVEHAEHD